MTYRKNVSSNTISWHQIFDPFTTNVPQMYDPFTSNVWPFYHKFTTKFWPFYLKFMTLLPQIYDPFTTNLWPFYHAIPYPEHPVPSYIWCDCIATGNDAARHTGPLRRASMHKLWQTQQQHPSKRNILKAIHHALILVLFSYTLKLIPTASYIRTRAHTHTCKTARR